MKYVVVKASRRGSNRTYTGLTWESAGLMPPTLAVGMERHDLYLYDNREVAEDYAKTLSTVNPVGFVVEEYKD
jgi:hypothetical protein